MKYIFNEDYNLSLKDRILQLNKIDYKSLDVSNFNVNYNLNIIKEFKEKLLSYKDKRFFIVGDYDCDGICATTIIKKLFDDLKIESNYYIPSRTKEGYGLNNNIIDVALNNNFDCLICLDNGISAKQQLAYAKTKGLKVFIIDHHEYQDKPDCEAFLHPNIFDEDYYDMCASGLCALLSTSFRYDEETIALGGLATLADMVSIFNYNRYLVKEMLQIIAKGKIRPINLLLGDKEVTYTNIQFNVIPKINAVSRLDDLMNVNYVVKFLMSDEKEALKYFDKIENINNARKNYSQEMVNLALRLIDTSKNIIVIRNSEFKEGLCGLVANRLLDMYKKPVIVLAEVDGMLKGSGRSVEGSNIYEYLMGTSDLFEAYGGHEMAVGLSMKIDNYDRFIDYIDNHELIYKEQFKDVLVLESNNINDSTLESILELQPFGTNFKEPLFGIKWNNSITRYVVAHRYPKFDINENLSAISFNTNFINQKFDYMIGKLNRDNYDQSKLSFVIEDLV